jgi:hypothetical protein
MNRLKKVCLLIIFILILTVSLFACGQPPEVVTVTFTVEGRIHREYIIAHGQGLEEVPEVPQKEGYLAEWSITDFSELYQDTTVTAVYTKNFFKVTFKSDNLIIRTTNVTIGTNPSSLPVVPPREGYNGAWSITDFTALTMDTVVEAVYTPIMLDITFVFSEDESIIKQVAYGNDFTDFPQIPATEGNTGVWVVVTKVDGEEVWSQPDFTAITQPITVAARYLPRIITIAFDDEGDISQQTLEYNQVLTLPTDLTKEGKIFGGWYLDDEYDQKAADKERVTDDFTLYAYWITINNAVAAPEELFEFTAIDGGFAIAAAPEAVLPDDIVLPNSYNGELVVKIAEDGFRDTSIKTIVLPVGITEIGENAFYGCSELLSAEFSDKNRLEYIGDYAFYGASSLNHISLAKTIKHIGDFAFDGCSELSVADIPQGSALGIIGERAFYGTKITELNISQNIIEIGAFAFANLYNLIINFEGLQDLERVGRYAFLNCTRLVSFNPQNILFIGDGAFAGCAALASLTVVGDTPINDYFGDEAFVGTAGSYLVSQTIKQRDSQGNYVLDGGKNVYIISTRRLPTSLSTITVRQGCVDIVDNLLNNCVSVHTINIPSTVQTIGKRAFAAEQGDANNLMRPGELNIADGSNLKEIGEGAFLRRTTFTNIVFPSTVTIIGNQAFSNAANLESITFQNAAALDYIGESAFAATEWMRQRPNGVVYLAGFALTYKGAVIVDEINLTQWADGVKAIAPFAFANTSNIKSVNIPATIKTIFESAFASCVGITSVIINEGVESIRDNAFKGCINLVSVTLPKSAKDLGKNILSGCNKLASLTVFGDRVAGEYFGQDSFTGSYEANQTFERSLAFDIVSEDNSYVARWAETKDLYGHYPQSYDVVVKGAYDSDGKLLDSQAIGSLSHSTDYEDFYEIEDEVYSFFISFSQGITDNGRTQFTSYFGKTFYIDEHLGLEDVLEVKAKFSQNYYIPLTLKKTVLSQGDFADRAITPFAFMNFISLQEITLPDGLVSIGEGAFLNCAALGSKSEDGSIVILPVVIPASLKTIGKDAFKGGISLYEISYGVSPQLAEIGKGAFENSALTSFYVPATVRKIGDGAFANSDISILQFESSAVVTDNNGVVQNSLQIGESAFEGCNALMNVVFPDRTVSIGALAFANNAKLGTVTFGAQSRLSELGESAFANNALLTTISLPKELNLDSLHGIFAGNSAMSELTLYNTNIEQPHTATLGMLFGTATFSGSDAIIQNGVTYHVPRALTTIKFLGGSISAHMFQNAAAIKLVELSDITEIGASAFENCIGIEKIDLPSMVEAVGENAFKNCAALTAFNISQDSMLETIGSGAFSGSALNSFYIPDGVTRIEPYTFYDCAELENVGIASVIYVGEFAFYGCQSLKMLEFSEHLQYIGDNAFYNCQTAEIPFVRFEELVFVGNFAFYNCLGLTALNAENLQTVGIKAFSGAYNIQEVTIPGNTSLGSVFGSTYFENTYEVQQNGTYYLPQALTRARVSSTATAVAASAFKDAVSLNDIIFHAEIPPVLGAAVFENTSETLKLFVPVAHKQAYLDSYADYVSKVFTHPTEYDDFEFIHAGEGYSLVKAKDGAQYSGVLYIPAVDDNGRAVIGIAPNAFVDNADIVEVIIPAGIRTIGDEAFKNCAELKKVLFEGGSLLEQIGKDAFNGCIKLTGITIPKTTRTIGDYAFAGIRVPAGAGYNYFSQLSTVEFEKDSQLESIGKYAFYLTKNLKSIYIPSSVTHIGAAAFSGSGIEVIVFGENSILTAIAAETFRDSALKSIELPDGIETIGKYAFQDCVWLATAALGTALERIEERAFYNAELLVQLALPSTLTYIGNESFRFSSSLESITLPESVAYLGDYAFAGASRLYEVLGSMQNIDYIGEYAFMDTPWLAEQQDASLGVVYLNNIAYSYKGAMPAGTILTLREGTTGISPRAFENQINLVGINIPATVKTIGERAFYGCSLESLVFEEGSQLESIGNHAFYASGFAELPLLENLKDIGAYAFANNEALTSIVLPESIQAIGEGAFSQLSAIDSELYLPNALTSIGAKAFMNSGFSIYILSESQLSYIGSQAFSNTAFVSAVIPAGITKLNDAFSNTAMDNVMIPAWVTEISIGAFKQSQIGSISIANNNQLIKISKEAFYGLSQTLFELNNLTNLKEIGERAFYGCKELQKLVGDSVSFIGLSAFEGCQNLEEIAVTGGALAPLFGGNLPSTLTTINITAGTTTIAESAFSAVDSVETIHLPATIKRISRNAFNGASNLETIILEKQETLTMVGKDAFKDTKWLNNQASGTVYIGKIAYSFKGDGTTAALLNDTIAVAEYAFSGNTQLTQVSLPAGVTTIEERAFAGCTGLLGITLAIGSALKTIGERAFENCTSLESITIPAGVQSIAPDIFAGCSAIASLNYNGSKNLGYLFGRNSFTGSYAAEQNGETYYLPEALKDIRIVDNSTKVVEYCMQNAVEIATVILAISIKEIGAYAFDGCSGISQINVIRGSGLEKIGDFAFRNCSGLTTLYLPDSVNVIGQGILNAASALAELTVGGYALPELFGTDSFEDSYTVEYEAVTHYLPLSLKTIIIADGTSSLAPYAYASSRIESITVSASLETIGEYAFYGAALLADFVQPSNGGIKEIKAYAFADTALTSIIIHASVEKLGERAFYNIWTLAEVDMRSEYCQVGYQAFHNTHWHSNQDGLVYVGTTLLGYSGQMPEDYRLVIDEGTTDIAANAFESKMQLISVTIPSSVMTIGAAAFKNCINLVEVAFDGVSSLQEISNQLFYNSTALAAFAIPAAVTKIGDEAFYMCTAFEQLTFSNDSGLEEIGRSAFKNSALTSVSLPGGLKKIGDSAFAECSAITAINFANADTLEHIGDLAFHKNRNALFGANSFASLSHIGEAAFHSCENLLAIYAPQLEYVGAEAFKNCLELTAVTMTENVRIFDLFGYADNDITGTKYQQTVFEEQPFRIPVSLVLVYYSEVSTQVKDNAFAGCQYITEVLLPHNLTKIGVSAFENSSIVSAAGAELLQSVGAKAFKNSQLTSFDLPITILTIGEYAFENCGELLSVTLAAGSALSTIGAGVFRNAINAEFDFSEIARPLTVGEQAFKNCGGLTSFIAPNVISYGDGVFDGCGNLVSLTVTTDTFIGRLFGTTPFEGAYAASFGGIDYYIPFALANIYVAHSMSIVADSAFAGITSLEYVYLNGVSSIGKHAFSGILSLNEISIPASVVIIDDFAFEGNENLAVVELELADTLTYIGEGAFDDTVWYADVFENASGTVYIGKVAYAYKGAISGLLSLRSDTVGIAPKAFINQTEMTEIRLPLTVSAIGAGAFQNCSAVETIYTVGNFEIGRLFGEQAYGMSYAAVQNGKTYYIPQALTGVYVINGVTQLAPQAFAGCYTLTSITLPSTLYNIGAEPLKGCYGLTTITVPSSIVLGRLFGTASYPNSYAAQQNTEQYYFPLSLRTINTVGAAIAAHAYQNLSSLTAVNIESSINRIGAYALAGCSGLMELSLHSGITAIDEYALAGCNGITSLNLPSNATLGTGVLSGCSTLNSLSIKGSAALHSLFGTSPYDNSYQARQANKYYYIPSSLITIAIKDVTVIPDGLLEGFSAVSTLTLPNNITKIGANAFYGLQVLNEIALPSTLIEVGNFAFADNKRAVFNFVDNNIQKVGAGAFQNCFLLTSFDSPSIVSIGESAFNGCSALAALGIRSGYVIGRYFGQQMFVETYAAAQQLGEAPMTYYIPHALSAVTVYGDGALTEYMFANMTGLKSVSLLGEVSIPSTAFIGCTGVTAFDGANIIYIEKDALLPLPWLNTYLASRPNNTLVYIGRVAYKFKGIMDIGANISFATGTTQLYHEAFANQARLVRVNISENMRYIDISAFQGCTGMNYIAVAENNEYFSSVNGILYDKSGDTLIYRPLAMT